MNTSRPKFGVDYDVGDIGFTYVAGFVSTGVAHFEHWNQRGPVRVTHALVVSGEQECIEAHIDEGVARVSLAKYFDDPGCWILFRRPRDWDPALGRSIAAAAAAQVGSRYNTSLVLAAAAADTLAGHWFNRLFHAWPNRLVSRLFDRPNRWICSELAAYALAQQPALARRGVLRFPFDTIDPQELFEDRELFAEAPATIFNSPVTPVKT